MLSKRAVTATIDALNAAARAPYADILGPQAATAPAAPQLSAGASQGGGTVQSASAFGDSLERAHADGVALGHLQAGTQAPAGATVPGAAAPTAAPAAAPPAKAAETVDWDQIVAEQNASVAKQPGAVIPAGAPTAKPASAGSMWDDITAEHNAALAKADPRAVIPGAAR